MKTKIDALTGLRFFAAAAIVLHHLGVLSAPLSNFTATLSLGQGVSVFFVLSGFILTLVYPKLDTRRQTIRFFIARFARIWPAHACLLLAVILIYQRNPAGDPALPGATLPFIANLTLTQSFIPLGPYFFSYNAVSWSISTEAGFYLLFPLIIRKFAATWHWKLALALVVSLSMVWLASHLQLQPYPVPGMAIPLEGVVYVNPLARIFEFVLGAVTALAWGKLQRHTGPLAHSLAAWTVMEFAALAFLAFNISIVRDSLLLFTHSWDTPAQYWISTSFSPAIPSALLILTLASSRGALSSVLGWRPIKVLGEISFSIYLVHPLAIRLIARYQDALGDWGIPLCVAVILLASTALWYIVEMPLRDLVLARWNRSSSNAASRRA